MGTLDEIQRLSDGQFHLLGDNLLPRMETRYRRIRTHGLNERRESIRGQPDSYVGDTAATCDIAVCYTVQRAGWWNKVVQDVGEAVAACPMATEVVAVIPHNSDRDGPKDRSIDWLSSARAAAGNATFRLIEGRDISKLLDSEHQDLRYEHLRIPYSRVSGPSILAGCRTASLTAIDSIKSSGRYDPARYSARSADRELYRLWQSAHWRIDDRGRRITPVRLIPLVNDSGVGKTSLVCEFTRTLGAVLPVLLVQARDITFATEDALVAAVIHAIQGFLDPSARVIEEAALSKLLVGSVSLTVVLDGLDEAHAGESVRKAITYWLRSKLCQAAILIVTSRREFWRTCVDPLWVRWMPNSNSDERSPINVAERSQVETSDPIAGFRLPDRFSEPELEAAWLRAGRTRSELFTLTAEAREELRHPFTLRIFFDLQIQEAHAPRTVTRATLLERWLNRRLDAEELPNERITSSHFQQALRLVARRITETNAASVSVDRLDGAPRYDPSRPPGPVLQRLIEASILETLPRQSDRIRFTVEAVQDFYRADADIEDINEDPKRLAAAISRLTFTTAYPRLVRIGYRLVGEDIRHEFIRHLLEADSRKAAIVMRAQPACYTADAREKIAHGLGTQITGRHRVRAAMAITLLGELNCQEAIETLVKCLLPPAGPHHYLTALGGIAFTKLNCAPAANAVYSWNSFRIRRGFGSQYFREILAIVRAATDEFRIALGDQAVENLSSATGTQEHFKAVIVLAYLGDGRLLNHLATRLAENGLLDNYENHALIALGSGAAGELFAKSVMTVGELLAPLPNDGKHHDARNKLLDRVHFPVYDVQFLLTPAFEPHLQRLIEDANRDVSWIAIALAKHARAASLLYSAAVAASKRGASLELDPNEVRTCVNPDLWLEWWRQSADASLRGRLLTLLPHYPNAEIEEVLLECLDLPDLCGTAVMRLGEYGAIRSARSLREILGEEAIEKTRCAKSEAAHALGCLRDDEAVPLLERVAAEHSDGWVVLQAIGSLGLIGNSEAESALVRLLQLRKGDDFENKVFEAILCCGSSPAVSRLVQRAAAQRDGVQWLCERLDHLNFTHGWRSGEYFAHIQIAELVGYVESHFEPRSPEHDWHVGFAFRQIDSPEVRALLLKWASRRGSPEDPLVRESDQRRLSDICYWELRDRGDAAAIAYVLDESADERDAFYVARAADQLRIFSTAAVGEELRLRLSKAETASDQLRMLALLGRYGEPADADLASRFVDDADELLANVACEAMLRLSDPLLVPDYWREL